MTAHYLAFGPYDQPQVARGTDRNTVQLVEGPAGFFHRRDNPHWVDQAGVTPERALLNDLVATMEAIQRLYSKCSELTDEEDALLSKLDARRFALEDALQRAVTEKLGLDYAVLWHAITPSGPIPKLP